MIEPFSNGLGILDKLIRLPTTYFVVYLGLLSDFLSGGYIRLDCRLVGPGAVAILDKGRLARLMSVVVWFSSDFVKDVPPWSQITHVLLVFDLALRR